MITATPVSPEGAALQLRRLWPRELLLWLFPLILVMQITIWSVFLPKGGLRGIADFRPFYTGGYMIRTGHRKELCNYDAQKRFEDALVPVDIDFMLPMIHLPFEELLFVPLSVFSYRTAYWIFLACNSALVVVCFWILKPKMQVLADRWQLFPILLFAGFYPISRALVQGQDSIILLALLAGAFWYIDRDRDLIAGLLIGIGVFKFQIVIPLVFLLLVWRRWRVAAGFAVSAAAATMISFWLVGVHGMREYAETLAAMTAHLNSRADILHYGAVPSSMVNIRGLITALLGGTLSHFGSLFVIFALSVAVLLIAAWQRLSFQLAIMASSLVSYHFLCHDASILVIPLVSALCSTSVWLGAVAVLFYLISFAAVIPQGGFFGAIPVLALFFLSIASTHEEAKACPKLAN